jgi:hypothetical protein
MTRSLSMIPCWRDDYRALYSDGITVQRASNVLLVARPRLSQTYRWSYAAIMPRQRLVTTTVCVRLSRGDMDIVYRNIHPILSIIWLFMVASSMYLLLSSFDLHFYADFMTPFYSSPPSIRFISFPSPVFDALNFSRQTLPGFTSLPVWLAQ